MLLFVGQKITILLQHFSDCEAFLCQTARVSVVSLKKQIIRNETDVLKLTGFSHTYDRSRMLSKQIANPGNKNKTEERKVDRIFPSQLKSKKKKYKKKSAIHSKSK